MEKTLENKAKLFALYWGQNIIEDEDNSGNKNIYPVVSSNMYCFQESVLLLNCLSKISEYDCLEISKICAKGWFSSYYDLRIENIKKFAYLYSRNSQEVTDYLRSKGYALPYTGLSVETLVEYGWVKLWEANHE